MHFEREREIEKRERKHGSIWVDASVRDSEETRFRWVGMEED